MILNVAKRQESPSNKNRAKRRRFRNSVLIIVACIGAGIALGWSGNNLIRPAETSLDKTDYTFVTVSRGTVGSSIELRAEVTWPINPAANNLASGTVTAVKVKQGELVHPGAVLYEVNLRPVAVAVGNVPAFRKLSLGDEGEDVSQLQQMLAGMGLLSGHFAGTFGRETETAVRVWQRSLNLRDSGEVERGELLFVPRLPAKLSLDLNKISRGLALVGGETAVNLLAEEPIFELPVTKLQAGRLREGTKVKIVSPSGKSWHGTVGPVVSDATSGALKLPLKNPDSRSLCGNECGEIPTGPATLLKAEAITVESVAGLTVPTSALMTSSTGKVFVTDREGQRHEVTVVANSQGMTVIEGAEEGLSVRAPSKEHQQ